MRKISKKYEVFELDSRTYLVFKDISPNSRITLLRRVPYRNCFGKKRVKLVTLGESWFGYFEEDLGPFPDKSLENLAFISKSMLNWFEMRRITKRYCLSINKTTNKL